MIRFIKLLFASACMIACFSILSSYDGCYDPTRDDSSAGMMLQGIDGWREGPLRRKKPSDAVEKCWQCIEVLNIIATCEDEDVKKHVASIKDKDFKNIANLLEKIKTYHNSKKRIKTAREQKGYKLIITRFYNQALKQADECGLDPAMHSAVRLVLEYVTDEAKAVCYTKGGQYPGKQTEYLFQLQQRVRRRELTGEQDSSFLY